MSKASRQNARLQATRELLSWLSVKYSAALRTTRVKMEAKAATAHEMRRMMGTSRKIIDLMSVNPGRWWRWRWQWWW